MTGFQLCRKWRVLLLGPSLESAGEVRAILQAESAGVELFEVRAYPGADAIPKLFQNQGVSICFLDAATSPDIALPLIQTIQQAAPEVAIVAMLATAEPDSILGCLRRGASEFLTHPISAEQLEPVLRRIGQSHPHLAAGGAGAGHLIVVAPVKGASGASTVALNLAFQRKRLGLKNTLLCDFDALAGTISFMLSAKPSYSFLDALGRGASLDMDVWKGLIQTIDGIDVLHAPELAGEAVYEIRDPAPLLEFARQHYAQIVADLGSVYGDWNVNTLAAADEIILVATSDHAALRSAERALRHLTAHRIPAGRVRVVMNRFHQDFSVPMETARQVLQREVLIVLPADYDAVHRALIEGKPTAPGSAFGKGLATLADALRGEKPQTEKPASKSEARTSKLSGFFTLLSRKPSPSR